MTSPDAAKPLSAGQRLGELRALVRRRGMESNAMTIAISTGLTGVLGLVYWVVAERLFTTAEVGRASAVMSAATMLSSLSGLALGGMYERFLADAGRHRLRFVVLGLAATSLIGLVVGGIFLLVGPTDSLFESSAEYIAFPITAAILTLYALLDPILIAIRRPQWLAAKNVLLSVAKIIPLFPLAAWGSALAITGSWAILAALASGVAMVAAVRLIHRQPARRAALPPFRDLAKHHGALVSLMAMGVLAPLVVPLIVISHEGPEAAAHFNIAWILVSSVGLILSTMMSSFVVEASAESAGRQHELLRRMVRFVGRMAVVCIGGLAIFGPLVLLIVGPDYIDAVGYLWFMVPALMLQQVIMFFAALSRLAGRFRLLVSVQALGIVGIIGGSFLLVGPLGMTGVGVAIMCTDLLGVLIIALPLASLVREGRMTQLRVEGEALDRVHTGGVALDAEVGQERPIVLMMDAPDHWDGVQRVMRDLADGFVDAGRPVEIWGLHPQDNGGRMTARHTVPERFIDGTDTPLLYSPMTPPQRAKLIARGERDGMRAFDTGVERLAVLLGQHQDAVVVAMQLRSAEYLVAAGVEPARLILHYQDSYSNAAENGDVKRIQRLMPHARVLLTLSEEDAERFRGAGVGTARVLRNPIDVAELRRDAIAHEKVVVVRSRLTPRACLHVMIDAWQRAGTHHSDWELRIFGDGPLRADLQRRIDEAGARVRLMGETTDFPSEIARASINALSAAHEGTALVIAQAMVQGVPSVATDAGPAVRELIVDGETGVLVPVDDADALADALDRLIRDPALRDRLGAAGRSRVDMWGTPTVIEDWNRLLAGQPGTHETLR